MPEPLVLILDDEPALVRLCQRLLDKAGFRTLAATSPKQALAILGRQPVQAMLIDIRMPGMDGYQFLTLARDQHPDAAAVIMTGLTSLEVALSTLRIGADGLILKPFSGAELIETLNRALENTEHRRDGIRLRTLRPLFELVEKLIAETDLQKLYDLVVNSIYTMFDCSYVVLFSFDSQELQIYSSKGEALPLKEFLDDHRWSELFGVSIPAWASRDNQTPVEAHAVLDEYGISSLICVEMQRQEESLSLLVTRSLESPPFRDTERETFAILARQVTLALENAHLYNQLRTSVEKLARSQKAMNQAEKMATAGRLTASIAHEINNPLQALQNWLHLARRKDLPEGDSQRYLQLAQTELGRLHTTVQRMLDFYRPGARDLRSVDINELVLHVFEMVKPQLGEANIQASINLQQDLPPIMGVASQIQQVLLNIIVNAVEAMPEGGHIHLTTKTGRIENPGEPSRPSVDILIDDTGPGVPEEDRQRIFEPFVSTKEHGTGLGLAMSYGIITAHGGKIDIVPSLLRGACFRISIPEERE